ncbi:hypothetical protein FCJ59_26275 [Cupriavidus basilensis]|nr:hypothetical protein [Cupriavidus basilensis]
MQVLGFGSFGRLTPMRRLISASCSSGQRFASGFLQTPSRPENPCLPLTLPLAGCVGDLHPQVSAPCRAHRIKKRQPALGWRYVLGRTTGIRTGSWCCLYLPPSGLLRR